MSPSANIDPPEPTVAATLPRTCPFHALKRAARPTPFRSPMIAFSMLLTAGGMVFILWQLYRQQSSLHDSLALPGTTLQAAMCGVGLLGLALAIRGLRRNSRSLHQSEERVRAIIDSALDAVVNMDAAGLITAWNPQAESVFGWTREQALGRRMSETVIPQRYRQAHERGVQHFLSTGEGPVLNKRIEITALRRDGREFPIELSITPLQAGNTFSFAAFIRDISARKTAEGELEKANQDLLRASRQAGMAEVATGVLHNVGNVLNTVNVSSTIVADRLKRSKAANLSKVVALLREHEADLGSFITSDPRGKQVPAYLDQLAGHLAAEQAAVLQEVDLLRTNIEHIKDIVAMQQSYARVSGVSETVRVADLVEDSLRMATTALGRDDLELLRDLQSDPRITVDKHKALQILVNLIRNACQACAESRRPDQRLNLRVTQNDDRVRIAVIDNGVGIPPGNLDRIFSHGFTTRKDGHGFGLHSGALAAKEMGGALEVRSDGPGRGATFTLELPLNPPAQLAA